MTATFHHSSGDVIDLVVADEMDQGEHETIGTTGNHPFWSVDRQEFVQAGSLRKGEHLRTIHGETKRVVSKLARPGPEPVFNLEVYGEHTYFVGKDGVLVHNDYNKTKQIPGPAVSRDAKGRFHDALGLYVRNPGAPEVLSGTRNFNRGNRNFHLEQGNASSGWKHIWDRHVDPTRFVNKSKIDFDATESEILEVLSRTLKHGNETTHAGRSVFEFRTRFRKSVKKFRVTVNADGSIRTFHPLD